jgi:hypothetical protein
MTRSGTRSVAFPVAFKTTPVRLGDPVYQRLTAIKLTLEGERGRQVSLSETVEDLVTLWERMAEAVAES